MVTHSSSPAWQIPRMEEPGGLQPRGSNKVNTTEHTHTHSNCPTKAAVRPYSLLQSCERDKDSAGEETLQPAAACPGSAERTRRVKIKGSKTAFYTGGWLTAQDGFPTRQDCSRASQACLSQSHGCPPESLHHLVLQ